jgi:hypothetical protein
MIEESLDQQVAVGDPKAVERELRTLARLERVPEEERSPGIRRRIAWCKALLMTPFDNGPAQG